MAYKNIYDSNSTFDYPNYPFPSEYTKSGQTELKNNWSKGVQVQQQATYPEFTPPRQTLNLTQILPLIKAMSAKGKVNTGDMIKSFAPFLSENSKNIGELISAFESISGNSKKHVSKIESYTRVEDEKSTNN